MKGRRFRCRNVEATARSSAPEGLDMISALQQHLIEEILLRLPLRDAVRTSVLSSNWRGKWTTLPRLVFSDRCLSPVARLRSEAIEKAIDNIFALHRGQVEAFEFVLLDNCPNSRTFCRWILHLSTLSINKLKIFTGGSDLGSCLFACQDLVCLKLYNCSFRLPSHFTGLKNLRKLVLGPALVAQDMLENLVSSCPQLMKMRILVYEDSFSHLKITALNLQHIAIEGGLKAVKIDAPGLKHLEFNCCIEDIEVNTNCLLSLKLVEEGNEDPIADKADAIYRCLLGLFVRQSQLQFVDLGIKFIQYLCLSGFPKTLCNSLLHLKHLVVSINLSSVQYVSSTLCFLKSCPNLETIDFWVSPPSILSL